MKNNSGDWKSTNQTKNALSSVRIYYIYLKWRFKIGALLHIVLEQYIKLNSAAESFLLGLAWQVTKQFAEECALKAFNTLCSQVFNKGGTLWLELSPHS